jgi:hypothetical protein
MILKKSRNTVPLSILSITCDIAQIKEMLKYEREDTIIAVSADGLLGGGANSYTTKILVFCTILVPWDEGFLLLEACTILYNFVHFVNMSVR